MLVTILSNVSFARHRSRDKVIYNIRHRPSGRSEHASLLPGLVVIKLVKVKLNPKMFFMWLRNCNRMVT